MVGIEEKLFQAATVAEYLIRDSVQVAMPLVHRLDVAVAAPQRNALQHVRPPWGIWLPALLRSPHRRVKVSRREVDIVGEGLPDVKSLVVFSRLRGTEGRDPLRNKIIP